MMLTFAKKYSDHLFYGLFAFWAVCVSGMGFFGMIDEFVVNISDVFWLTFVFLFWTSTFFAGLFLIIVVALEARDSALGIIRDDDTGKIVKRLR